MRRLLLIAIFMLVLVTPAFSDILYLNQGEEVVGVLQSSDKDTVKFKEISGKVHEYKPSEIAHILISTIRQGDEISNVADIKDAFVKKLLKDQPAPSDFVDSNYVTLSRTREFEFTKDGRVNYTRRELVKVLKEPGLDKANRSLYYLKDEENCKLLFAHTYAPDGKIYHITDDAISDEAIYSATPEYAKLKKLKLALKKVDIGSIIDFSYRQDLKKTDILHPYAIMRTFGEREPVLNEIVRIKYPKSMKIELDKFQWAQKNLPIISEKDVGDTKTITFTFKDLKGFIPEQSMLSISRIFPKIVAFIKYDWDKMAAKLSEAYKKSAPDKELLEAFVKSAKIDNLTNFEKVAALYKQINKEIQPIGMSIGDMGSFIPVSANVTLKKRYGNQQARVALLFYALKSIGIEAEIGFSSYKHDNVVGKKYPNLYFTEEPILRVIIDGEEYFTDGGSLYRPFGTLSTSIQGAKAIYVKNNKIHFIKLPEQTSDWNRYDRNVFVKLLENGTMKVHETIQFRGPFETSIRAMRSAKEKEKRMYAEKRVKRVHPNAILNDYALSDLEDLDAPVVLTLNYTIPEAAQKASDKIMTFKNFWINYDSSSASLAKRKFPMRYWATEENTQTIIFELPKKFKWVKWNKQYRYNSGKLSFLSDIKQTGNTLVYIDKFVSMTTEFLDNAAYQRYRNCTLVMSNLANQWIVLENPESASKPVNKKIKKIRKLEKKPVIDAPEPQG